AVVDGVCAGAEVGKVMAGSAANAKTVMNARAQYMDFLRGVWAARKLLCGAVECGRRIWQRFYKGDHSGDALNINQSSNVYRAIGVFDFAIASNDDRNPHRSFQSGVPNGEKTRWKIYFNTDILLRPKRTFDGTPPRMI